MKDFIVGLSAVIGIILGIIILGALFLAIVYAFGWATGWVLHLMVGPDMVFGVTFEQFIALINVVTVTFIGTKQAVKSSEIKKLEEIMKEKSKEYRGY
jgi:hypothetical protein